MSRVAVIRSDSLSGLRIGVLLDSERRVGSGNMCTTGDRRGKLDPIAIFTGNRQALRVVLWLFSPWTTYGMPYNAMVSIAFFGERLNECLIEVLHGFDDPWCDIVRWSDSVND